MAKRYRFALSYWLKYNKEMEIHNYYDLGMLTKCTCVVSLKELIQMWKSERSLDKLTLPHRTYVSEESHLVARERINTLPGVNWSFICGILVDSGI